MKKSEIIDGIQEFMQDKSAAARSLAGRWTNIALDDLASRGLLKSLQREERTPLIAGDGSSMTQGRDYVLADDTDKPWKVFVPDWGYPEGILKKIDEEL
jgi:hypothetical protein